MFIGWKVQVAFGERHSGRRGEVIHIDESGVHVQFDGNEVHVVQKELLKVIGYPEKRAGDIWDYLGNPVQVVECNGSLIKVRLTYREKPFIVDPEFLKPVTSEQFCDPTYWAAE